MNLQWRSRAQVYRRTAAKNAEEDTVCVVSIWSSSQTSPCSSLRTTTVATREPWKKATYGGETRRYLANQQLLHVNRSSCCERDNDDNNNNGALAGRRRHHQCKSLPRRPFRFSHHWCRPQQLLSILIKRGMSSSGQRDTKHNLKIKRTGIQEELVVVVVVVLFG